MYAPEKDRLYCYCTMCYYKKEKMLLNEDPQSLKRTFKDGYRVEFAESGVLGQSKVLLSIPAYGCLESGFFY